MARVLSSSFIFKKQGDKGWDLSIAIIVFSWHFIVSWDQRRAQIFVRPSRAAQCWKSACHHWKHLTGGLSWNKQGSMINQQLKTGSSLLIGFHMHNFCVFFLNMVTIECLSAKCSTHILHYPRLLQGFVRVDLARHLTHSGIQRHRIKAFQTHQCLMQLSSFAWRKWTNLIHVLCQKKGLKSWVVLPFFSKHVATKTRVFTIFHLMDLTKKKNKKHDKILCFFSLLVGEDRLKIYHSRHSRLAVGFSLQFLSHPEMSAIWREQESLGEKRGLQKNLMKHSNWSSIVLQNWPTLMKPSQNVWTMI